MKNFFIALLLTLTYWVYPAFAMEPVVDKDYKIVSQVSSVQNEGKVEVLAFFWYGCPHCSDFEKVLEPWIAKQSKDVTIRRIPVAFNEQLLVHTRLYYTLEAMGKVNALHEKLFQTLQKDYRHFMKVEDITNWAEKNGLNREQFRATFDSFGVTTKVNEAKKITEEFRIESVPAVIVQGKYLTSPAITNGSKERTIDVLDWLIKKSRDKRR
ncbi:MAG: thiol:disulfide interchange protein DsbA/DsbL [Ottowia sp.]|nr:thiol:disulfide interchange protein DsbA/DsbL [Ottowia sp.]